MYAVGNGLTVTITDLITVAQPDIMSVTFKVYVLVAFVVATGLGKVASSSPKDGVHRYVNVPEPPDAVGAPPRVVGTPSHIIRGRPASAVGLSYTLIVNVWIGPGQFKGAGVNS